MIEVADIFREYGQSYRKNHKLPMNVLKAMNAIEKCRTAELGGHISKCDNCGHKQIFYNSCRNRHCPKCQSLAKERWLLEREKDLLPVEYFHVVLTVPNQLSSLILGNQRILYNILFKAGSEALLELGKDPEHLGAEIGFISILHTWGQNLMNHPHLHCIVPGGGLSKDEKRWISTMKGFFIPVKVLSRLFRGKFLFYLKEAYRNDKLKFTEETKFLSQSKNFQKLLEKLYQIEWVVYCKPPFHNAREVLKYLGRYTHRVAISNHRLISLENDKVTFRWRDYRDENKQKMMTIDVFEFIRRFLLHILPTCFVKIRHYGILSNRNCRTKLKKCQAFLNVAIQKEEREPLSWEELLFKLTGLNPGTCPNCQKGKMITCELLQTGKDPPNRWRIINRFNALLSFSGKLSIESP